MRCSSTPRPVYKDRCDRLTTHIVASAGGNIPDGTGFLVDAASITTSRDTYGNLWALTSDRTAVLVRPSKIAPISSVGHSAEWRVVPAPASATAFVDVTPDEAGFVWLATSTELWVMSPRSAGSGPVDAGVGHKTAPAANTADPEWRRCPDEQLIASLPPITGLRRSQADAPAVVLLSGTGCTELTVQKSGRPVLCRPVELSSVAPRWKMLGRLPGGNHDLFATECAGALWMAGGLSVMGFPAHNYCFDELWRLPLIDSTKEVPQWQVATRMPEPRNYNGIVELQGEIWVVGGVANRHEPTNPRAWRDSSVTQQLRSVHVFSPTTGDWKEGPSLRNCNERPYAGGPVVVRAGERVWALATGTSTTCATSVETVESIGLNEVCWREEPSLPPVGGRWCSGAAGCCIEGTIYILAEAGFAAIDTLASNPYWDSSIPQHPMFGTSDAPLSAGVVAHNGEVWVLGGAGLPHGKTWIYSPANRSWRTGPELPTPQAWFGAVSAKGVLYVLSGGHKMQFHPNPWVGWGGGATHYDDRCWALIE